MMGFYFIKNIPFVLLLIFNINILEPCLSSSLLTPLQNNNLPLSENWVQIITEKLESGPNLKDEISKLENSDFLEQYKLGETNEDKNLNIFDLTAKYGYKLTNYTLQTEDGYIINPYRIQGDGEPVLLVHGLFNSAQDWFTIGWDNALPYLLADRGYDVWLFNARGSTGRTHVSQSIESDPSKYWNFSWDEIARYDLAASIDFVLQTTGKESLKLVGHSQGTTISYVLASEQPVYNNKISLMVSLSPIAYMSHLTSPLIRILAPIAEVLKDIIGPYIDSKNPLITLVMKVICGDTVLANIVCENSMSAVAGFDYDQVNVTQMPVIYGHTPASVSTKQLVHYAQEINSGKFRQYDYGLEKNTEKYGTPEPPNYHVERINTSVALFYRKHSDWLSAYEDVEILYEQLPNVVDFYEVPHETWSHTDYIWGKDNKLFVYKRILKLFENY